MAGDFKALDERSREVLASVVSAHIRSAAPVSSRHLSRSGAFALSSASLRNAMADLEELGFLTHPHVSAGRIPTDLGYRTFVRELMRPAEPSVEDREQMEAELGGEGTAMDRFLQSASRVLSRLTGEVAVVTAPDARRFALESVHFTRVAERKVLVVQVSQAGLVDTRLVETREDYAQAELDAIGKRITVDYARRPLLEIGRLLMAALEEERVRLDAALTRALELARLAFSSPTPAVDVGDVWVEGTERIFDKAEYRDVETLRRLFGAFEEKARLVALLADCIASPAASIVIGSESDFTGEIGSSVVTAGWGRGDEVLGVVGVIGPKRMPYSRVIPLVQELGRTMTRRLTEGAA
jgi:heat-inducible transcriptional repressor